MRYVEAGGHSFNSKKKLKNLLYLLQVFYFADICVLSYNEFIKKKNKTSEPKISPNDAPLKITFF